MGEVTMDDGSSLTTDEQNHAANLEKLQEARKALTSLQTLLENLDNLEALKGVNEHIDSINSKIAEAEAQEICNLTSAESEDESLADDASVWSADDEIENLDPDYEEVDEKLSGSDAEASAGASLIAVAAPETTSNETIPYAIKFAPQIRPVKGEFEACAVAMRWTDNNGEKLNAVSSMAHATANTYQRLSNGLVKIHVTAKAVDVPFKYQVSNLYPAEDYAKDTVNKAKKNKNKKYDFYFMVNNNVRGKNAKSNAGGDTTHLSNTLKRTAYHELGHLKPFILGHAGIPNDAYGDGGSFMGKFNSNTLNGPALYALGWLEKVALHDPKDPIMEYKLETLDAKQPSKNLKGILIPQQGRDLFLSFTQVNVKIGNKKKKANTLALYRFQDEEKRIGTTRIGFIGGKETEFAGLTFERMDKDGNTARVRIKGVA